MSTFIMTLVVGLVRWWVGRYTTGLPPEVRDSRRAEIESDLWEQEREPSAAGYWPNVVALQMFVRTMLGIPADLSWHVEQAIAARRVGEASETRGNVSGSVTQKGFMGVAALMAAFTIIVGVLVSLGMGESHVAGHGVPRFVWGVVGLSAGAMILAGLWASKRSPLLGGILVVVGAVPLASILVWTIFLPVLWLLLAMFVVVRALRFARDAYALWTGPDAG